MPRIGTSVAAVAGRLGISRNTVTNVRRRWNRWGAEGLADRPRSGRPPKATERYRRLLLRMARGRSKSSSRPMKRRPARRLGQRMERATGIRLGRVRIWELLTRGRRVGCHPRVGAGAAGKKAAPRRVRRGPRERF